MTHGMSNGAGSGDAIRILYLEDSEVDAELVQARLDEAGVDCVLRRVETQEGFIAALEADRFDLILSDNSLPSYDGLSALEKAHALQPGLPFIFVSGTMGEEAAIESLKAGATDYVLKGRLARLVPAVRRALREAEASATQSRQEARIQELAFYDALTGLPNRALLEDRLRMALTHAHRTGQGVAVLFLDLDQFKSVNDSLGHPAGDGLLQAIAARLARCLREGDTAARWGGDEFIVLLPDLPGDRPAAVEAALVVVNKIREVVGTPMMVQAHELECTASIGVALSPWDGTTVTDLIKHADTAMYSTKKTYPSGHQFFAETMRQLASEKLFLEQELRRALRRSELTVHYQPQVKTAGGRIIGGEALLRWPHPDLGWISPTRFIPLAEESGQIGALGEWVLDQVLIQIKSWRSRGLKVPPISVNVSPYQLKDPGFPGTVAYLLAAHSLPPQCLTLELTESAMMLEGSHTKVSQLAALGIALALDDFGTGYSCLGALKRLAIGTLKIDQSFVRGVDEVPSDAALVTAIIALARSLRLRIVAEGVETEPQRAFLDQQGCGAFQGFLFSPAIPPVELEGLLQRATPKPGGN